MEISIKGGLAEVNYQKGKRTYNKTVTLSTLMAAMMQEQGIKTPLLPFGTRGYIRNNNQHTVLLEFPAVVRPVRYVNNDGKKIFEGSTPFPFGLFKLTFIEQPNGSMRLNNTQLYALKRPIVSENDPLYHYPAPNVFADHGICWGSTFSHENAEIKSLADAGKVIDLFFSSQFNTHIHPRINIYDRYEDMLRAVKDDKTLNPEILSPAGRTFKEIL